MYRAGTETLKMMIAQCSFLFSFKTKVMFMRFVSFIAVDQQRALVFLKQHQKRLGNQKLRVQDRKEKQLERQ